MLDAPTDPYAMLDIYLLNKGKEAEEMPQTSISSTYARIYTRFADKNINIISTSASDSQIALVAEYIFNRPRDGKLIWPKIVVAAPTLQEALDMAEETIDLIRGDK